MKINHNQTILIREVLLMNQFNRPKKTKNVQNPECNLTLMYICMPKIKEMLKSIFRTVVRLSQLNLNIMFPAPET